MRTLLYYTLKASLNNFRKLVAYFCKPHFLYLMEYLQLLLRIIVIIFDIIKYSRGLVQIIHRNNYIGPMTHSNQ